MAGSLPKINQNPVEDLVAGATKLDQFQAAVQQAQQEGLIEAPKPTIYNGDLPDNLTDLDDDDLGDLLNKQSQWCGWVELVLARTTAAKNTAIVREEFIRAKIRSTLKAEARAEGKKLTVQDLNDSLEITQSVVEATAQRVRCENLFLLVKAHNARAQLGWDTISRRITQRGQEVERMKRESNVAGMNQTPTFQQRAFNRPSQG